MRQQFSKLKVHVERAGLHAHRAVGTASRQQDTDAVGVLLGQSAKKHVNRSPQPALRLNVDDAQVTVRELEVLVRRNDVDVIGLQTHALSYLRHRHGGVSLQHLRQGALVLGRQVEHHDKDHPRTGRQCGKEALQRPNAACRGWGSRSKRTGNNDP